MPGHQGYLDHQPDVLRPTMLEIASLQVLGQVPPALPSSPLPALSALSALEATVLPALNRPPCLVSFSGGMDSSFVLAAATRMARRQGLPDPVPVTWRFTDAPRAQESAWQDRVVADLKIKNWQILTAADDLDLIGPVARRLLTRYGVRLPVNSHVHLPLLELSRGGSLLTGWGGDQVLTAWQRRRRPTINGFLRSAVPDRFAAAVIRRRRDRFPWLHPWLSQQLIRRVRSEHRSEPRLPEQRVDWRTRGRDVMMANAGLADIAAENDVQLIHPLLDHGFLASLGRQFDDRTALSRSEILASISAGRLPDSATELRPKAFFREVFYREPTREFVRSWNGAGLDRALFNTDVLQRLWSQWPIPPNTAGLIQYVWLYSVGGSPGDGAGLTR